MPSDTTWFEDDGLLVSELRRTGHRSRGTPAISGYSDLKEIRRGGQGVVYLGTQVSTRRRVAVKVLLDGALASREARYRFEREIEIVAALRHPNIALVYDSGTTEDGRLYYIMEYIDGVGRDELIHCFSPGDMNAEANQAREIARQFESPAAALVLFSKICEAVHHAHQRGVIHRDLKPSNVRIDRDGEPHVLDFGLAKALDGNETVQVSRTGSFMGSLPWASPEQADGLFGRIDVRSDIYSLGVMLYQLLTGTFPYEVIGPWREILNRIQHSTPKSIREIKRGISDDVATIAMTCLAKEPERRYQSVGELARDIRHALAGEPIEAKRASAWYSVRRTLNRYRIAFRVIVAALVISVGFGIGVVWLWMRALDAEKLAEGRLADLRVSHAAEVAARRETELQIERTRNVASFLDSTMRAVDPWKHPGRDMGPMLEMLDGAVDRLGGAFRDQPSVEGSIAGTLGWDYWKLGLHDKAEELLRRAYRLCRMSQGEENSATLAALSDLASFLTDQSKHEESAELFDRLCEIQQRQSGPFGVEVYKTMNHLALNLDWQGRSVEAESYYRQALAGQTGLLGPYDTERLSTLNNLSTCLPALGKTVEAEEMLEELIVCRSVAQGPDHPETLQARLNHAQFVNQFGRTAESEPLFRDVIHAVEVSLGPNHPLASVACNNLASAVSTLGRPEEGLALTRRALDIQTAFAGRNHPTTLIRRNEYVTTLMQLGRWDEAIPEARDLVDQFEQSVGGQDWRTLLATGNLAFALNKIGHHDEAEALWKELIASTRPDEAASLDPVISARANLGSLFADQARWAEAEEMLKLAIAAQTEQGLADHWRTATMRESLGRVLAHTGRPAQAKAEFERAIGALSKMLGDEHEKTRRARRFLMELDAKAGS